jgi:hypothetical protein
MKEWFRLFSNLCCLRLFIDIKDGVTIHLVIRAPKSDTTANVSTGPTSSGTQAEVIIYIYHSESLDKFDLLVSVLQS